ncbi:hypothetical protein WJX81_004851 [Elliptochloris bilobata]|uniref:Uncharacterized protein n=1 Tax=Elliptochloris bilobata TaxID=381761 RepID=A0AAW1RRQ7_9CHLO
MGSVQFTATPTQGGASTLNLGTADLTPLPKGSTSAAGLVVALPSGLQAEPMQTSWMPFAPTATRQPPGRAAAAPFERNASATEALQGVAFAEGSAEAADAGLQNCLQDAGFVGTFGAWTVVGDKVDAPAARPLAAVAAAAAPAHANSSGASLDAFPEQAMGMRLNGNGSFVWQALDAIPMKIYRMRVAAAPSAGSAAAGVTWFDIAGRPLSKHALRLGPVKPSNGSAGAADTAPGGTGTPVGIAVLAPADAAAAAVWVGKWDRNGTLAVKELSFGGALGGTLDANGSAVVRELPRAGAGVCLNYLLDGPGADNGTALRQALQRLRPGSLRYPGGEKANSYLWAPPPFDAARSRPLLTCEAGWPATAPALYNLSAHDYVAPPLDFEGFMRLVDATGAEPYIVLNLAGKSNMEPAASLRFDASELKAGAVSWLAHIRARGYNVTRFELTNEAYNQLPVAAYAAAVAEWAPALKAALPGALLGASGPSFGDAKGLEDPAQAWWPELLAKVSSAVDFLVVHPYPVFGWDWHDYAYGNIPLTGEVASVAAAVERYAPEKDRARLRLAVTETGVYDYGFKWQNWQADTGHALVLFDLLGSILSQPRVDAAIHWTSHWSSQAWPALDDDMPGAVVDTLWPDERPTALGTAFELLARCLRAGDLLQATSSQLVRLWAVRPPGGGLTLALLNKAPAASNQTVRVSDFSGPLAAAKRTVFRGASDADIYPTLGDVAGAVEAHGGVVTLELPPLSVTMVEFGRR